VEEYAGNRIFHHRIFFQKANTLMPEPVVLRHFGLTGYRAGLGSAMEKKGYVTVEKGSVSVNGTSLTVCDSQLDRFSVAIIPYTYQHTNFHEFEVGTIVNIEFDIIGKYLSRMMGID
jgi:hypothetical protein